MRLKSAVSSYFHEVLIVQIVFDSFLMLLEAEAVLVVKLGDLSESVADGLQQGHVLGDTAPHTDAVVLVPD